MIGAHSSNLNTLVVGAILVSVDRESSDGLAEVFSL